MSSTSNWKKFFAEGIEHFRRQDIDKALESFDQAIRLANDTSYVLYDSRASAYEKQNRLKDALRDAKKTIDIAPQQWHGYFRSARLFAALGQADAALRMCSLALKRFGDGPKHEARRRELMDLRLHLEEQTKCPVSAMPVELLLIIFRLSRNPVILSHVCRRWREVALSQPTLWCSLVLVAPAKKALLKVREWHKRSRGRIMELNIRQSLAALIFPSKDDSRHPDDCTMYTNLLVALQHLDWTALKESHLEGVNAESFFYALNDGTGFVHQHLETLSITYKGSYEVILGTGPLEYNELPWDNLRALRLTNGGCNWEQLSTSMRHLTSFEYKIENAVFTKFHLFLQANPGLEKLVIEASRNYTEEVQDSLTLPHLRHLELSGVVPFPVKSGNLSLPSLQILRMIRLQFAASTLTELIEDSGTSFAELVELTARDCALGSQLLTSVLLQAPKLEILNCTGDAVNDAAESLTAKPGTALQRGRISGDSKPVAINLPILCPALSVLDLSQSASLKTGPVMRIVKERIALAASQEGGRYQLPEQDGDRVVSCIRSLKVDECPHIEAEILPWFRKNVAQFSCRYEMRRKR
ncbi:hypothetical protein EI94DRAFT_445392 [Lactarius quietus]|nr:hypothetical protein EI94DRAFT_445392 [Lactarius quietus]